MDGVAVPACDDEDDNGDDDKADDGDGTSVNDVLCS